MQKIKNILIVPILAMMLFSCASSKQSVRRSQTLMQRAEVTLRLDQREFNIGGTIKLWKNELIMLSATPMLGIEMARLEATQDSVYIFDKFNRRYTVMSYDEVSTQVKHKLNYKLLQQILINHAASSKPIEMNFNIGKHQLAIVCYFTNKELDTLKAPKRLNKNRFKQVSLKEIIPL